MTNERDGSTTRAAREPVGPFRGALLRAEQAIDGWVERRRKRLGLARPLTVDAHAGHAHANGVELFGRIVEQTAAWKPSADDGRLANLRGVGSLFATHEEAFGEALIRNADGEHRLTADEEGYLRASLPPLSAPPETRWDSFAAHAIDPRSGEPGPPSEMPILRVGTSARFGVISDIDDTVMRTGAENLARNLWTTFTGNPLTRHVYRHVPPLYQALAHHAGRRANPIFYLSSSPWNLYGLIHDVLTRNDVPWGPIFLRDFGLDEAKLIKGTHGNHKLGHARRLMEAYDGLPFLLIGDLGQADAEIYATLARERPGSVMGMIVHQPSERHHREKRRHIAEVEGLGIPVLVTRDYAEAEAFARGHGWIDAPGGEAA